MFDEGGIEVTEGSTLKCETTHLEINICLYINLPVLLVSHSGEE